MKTKLMITTAVAAVLGFSATVQATPVNGSISFNGDETAYANATGTGAVDSDLATAQSIVFNTTVVSSFPAPNGSFTGLGGDSVTMLTPYLNVNPTVVPGTAIWSVGGFWMDLTSLSTSSASATSLVLYGSGTLNDGNSADQTTGTWTATFTSGSSTDGVTFSWNSSAASNVPDGGTTVMLLGAALSGLALIKRKLVA